MIDHFKVLSDFKRSAVGISPVHAACFGAVRFSVGSLREGRREAEASVMRVAVCGFKAFAGVAVA